MTNPLILLFVLLTLTTTLSYSTTTTTTTTTTTKTTLFIKNSCNSTSFPTLCYSSLSKFSSVIKQSQYQLAQVATMVSLSNLKSAVTTTNSYYNQTISKKPVNTKTVKALKDCKELLSDAVDNTNYCISELKSIKSGGVSGHEALWRLSNVQTYMSAVLTKEDTCIDGLKEMGAVVTKVSGKVMNAEKYTSNALGLVNNLSHSYQ